MTVSSWVSILSLAIAFIALSVTFWQARRVARLTRNAHQIQVIADAFREIRSPGFLDHYRRVLDFPRDEALESGFESLPNPRKESAYAVCYFFEHLGVLITRQLIPGDVLISTMRTLIIRSWDALKPAIDAELAARRTEYPEYMGHDFLPHFRELVDMAVRQRDKPDFIGSPLPAEASVSSIPGDFQADPSAQETQRQARPGQNSPL